MGFWRIWYEDGSTFDSTQGGPVDAPPVGIVAIRQKLQCSSGHHTDNILKSGELLHRWPSISADWYWWRPDIEEWGHGDRDGAMDNWMWNDARNVKQGRLVAHDLWERMWLEICNDTDFA